MAHKKQVIGGPLEIGGRVLSLSRAIRAGDFVYLTGQIPMKNGAPMTNGTVEIQTRDEGVRPLAWLRDHAGPDAVHGACFQLDPPGGSAGVSDLPVAAQVKVEVVPGRPMEGPD